MKSIKLSEDEKINAIRDRISNPENLDGSGPRVISVAGLTRFLYEMLKDEEEK